jgi:hypothetical protein
MIQTLYNTLGQGFAVADGSPEVSICPKNKSNCNRNYRETT